MDQRGGQADPGKTERGKAEPAIDEDGVEQRVDADRNQRHDQERAGPAQAHRELAQDVHPEHRQEARRQRQHNGPRQGDHVSVLSKIGQRIAERDEKRACQKARRRRDQQGGANEIADLLAALEVDRGRPAPLLGAADRAGDEIAHPRHHADAHRAELVVEEEAEAAGGDRADAEEAHHDQIDRRQRDLRELDAGDRRRESDDLGIAE